VVLGYDGLSLNPSITPEFIERHLDKSWVWGTGGLSSNISITPEFIERHLDKHWCWYSLSRNTFERVIEKDKSRNVNINLYKDELLQKTWGSGKRVLNWCMDFQEKQDIEM